MLWRPTKFWYAVATMVGATVGIGFFGIPFAFAKAGPWFGLFFFVSIVGLVFIGNLLYGEVILRTHERHQFVGYVHRYLGTWGRRLGKINFWIAMFGAVIGVLVLNGQFLSQALSFVHITLSPVAASTLFFLVAITLVYFGLKTVSHVDFVMMIFFVVVTVVIAIVAIPHIQSANYSVGNGAFWFLPFGVILYAMNGFTGMSLMREVLVGQERSLKRAVGYAILIPALLYLVFTAVVVGVSGDVTSPEAIAGLSGFLGNKIVFLGSLFGFLTSSTIFISILTVFRESLKEDFRLRRATDFIFPIFLPFLLFLLGVRNFINIIGLVGGVAIGIDMILLLFMYAKVKEDGNRIPEYSMRLPNWLIYVMMGLFLAGAIYTLLV